MKKHTLCIMIISICIILAGCGEEKVLDKPSFSVNPGEYNQEQKVKINPPVGDDIIIYYTTDGTDPDTNTTKYDGTEILVTETQTIRAVAYSGEIKSEAAVAKYTINKTAENTSSSGENSQESTENDQETSTGLAATPTEAETTKIFNAIKGLWVNGNNKFYFDPENNVFQYADNKDGCTGTASFYPTNSKNSVNVSSFNTTGGVGFNSLSIDLGSAGDGIITIEGDNFTFAGNTPIFQ